MTKTALQTCGSIVAMAAACLAVPAMAQDKPADATAADSAATTASENPLDQIVVTAAPGDRTKLRSSISVTGLSQDTIQNFTPHSEAEVLRLIPGIQTSGTAGPGGNANIGVRGIPVSTGGSEYVQLQEDGLPTVLFGDIQFGNNDYWIRFDNNVERVEAVRGGSASTFASQGPGAVINYISKTGTTEGGEVALSSGINYREQRLDFDYGGHLSDTIRFHVGGFVKDGSGPDHIPFNAERGYQIKANVTKELPDNRGYLRLNFKRLDDREPTNTSQPSLGTQNGNTITGFSNLGNLDPRKYSSANIYNQNFQILNANGGFETVPNEGIHPKATAVGGEFHYEFGDHFSVTDSARYTTQEGAFANHFTSEGITASAIGQTIPNAFGTASDPAAVGVRTIGSFVYAAGPNQGKVYTSPYFSNSALVYVRMRDTGSVVNNFVADAKFGDASGVKVDLKAGVFYMRQNISMDWRINNYTQALEANSQNAPLDIFSGPNGTGTQLAANGLTGYNNQWGGCCGGRQYDLTYTDTAPFANLDAQFGGFDFDASIRYDSVKAAGVTYAPTAAGTATVTDALGTATIPTLQTSTTVNERLNYTKHYVSWSLGALYAVDNDTSVFVRASKGGRFNADRLTYSGNFNADGSLNQHGDAVSLNFLTQQEVGLKRRGRLGGASYNVELTYFRSQLMENNYDFTLLSRNPPQNPNISNRYHSSGVEFTYNVNYGGFHLNGFATYTNPKLLNLGTTPQSTPKFAYLVSPSYDAGFAAIGVSVNGQSSIWTDNANTVKLGSSVFVNGFVSVRPYPGVELGLNVNNLFNRIGYPGGANVQQRLSPTSVILDSSAVYGRTLQGSVRYRF
ncbi:TonB-dependent receptor [Novosphingobium lentum]|uniref:TonB-dependent receptor n=1 Tax=Novosphingobium lentum TaxID=145287 RepID=UPI000831B95F|nr:TonB-dependent receptor [Novosphingobium lentum]